MGSFAKEMGGNELHNNCAVNGLPPSSLLSSMQILELSCFGDNTMLVDLDVPKPYYEPRIVITESSRSCRGLAN